MTTITYTLTLATGPGTAPRRATLLLEFKDPVRQTYRQGILVLDAETPRKTWRIDVDASGSGQAFYTAVLEYEGGERAVRPPVPFTGTEATVGRDPAPAAVTVLPADIDWSAVSSVDVTVGGASHTFTEAWPNAWVVPLFDTDAVQWTTDYTMVDDSIKRRRSGVDTLGVVVIPPPPPPPPVPFNVEFAVAADDLADFKASGVTLRVTGPDGAVQTGELTKRKPEWAVDLVPSESGSRWFTYDWTVSYTDGTPDWTAPARAADGPQSIAVDDLGRILLCSGAIDFEVVLTVMFSWSYAGAPKSVELSRDQRSWLLRPGTDYDRDEPLTVGLGYALATGSAGIKGEAVPEGRFEVPYPFRARLIRLYGPGLLGTQPVFSRIQLTASTLEQGAGWALKTPAQSVTLTQGTPVWEARIAAVDPARAVLIYSGSATPADSGSNRIINSTKSPFELTAVGPDIQLVTVQISAQGVFWNRYSHVEASLWTGSDDDRADLQTFVFDRNSPDAWWAFLKSRATQMSSYRWSATYYPADGGAPQRKAATGGSALQLSLPPILS